LKTDNFKLWPSDKELPVLDYIVQSYDCAFTEKTSGDPTACTVWGTFKTKDKSGAILLDAWSAHLSYPELRKKFIKEWHSVYGKTSSRKGRKSLLQDLRAANIPAIPYNPGNADKVNRAHQVAPVLELGCLWIPESTKYSGRPITWAQDFLEQCTKFPNAEHDDYCDTFTQTMILLRDQGRFELQFAELDVVEEVDYKSKRRYNPYGV
jgi:predicted phage terminase large subunit-like protein